MEFYEIDDLITDKSIEIKKIFAEYINYFNNKEINKIKEYKNIINNLKNEIEILFKKFYKIENEQHYGYENYKNMCYYYSSYM